MKDGVVSFSRFKQATIEAANRAEATALLTRCGYRVYRPEADIDGEDLVLRLPDGILLAAQLKPRPYVDEKRYFGLGLLMLFPTDTFTPDQTRSWFLAPHDPLFEWVKERHGQSPKWDGRWHTPSPSKELRTYLAEFKIRPPAEPEADADV